MTENRIAALHQTINENLYGDLGAPGIQPTTVGGCQTWFDITGLAVATIGAASAEIEALSGKPPEHTLQIDPALSTLWFGLSLRPDGWKLPPTWNALSGIYPASGGGWIRLHTNVPLHRQAALDVLQCDATKDAVTKAVSGWNAEALEAAIAEAGGVSAELRSLKAWQDHPQGKAVNAEPLIAWDVAGEASDTIKTGPPEAPLSGIKVLDCTRILAGPSCTRFLAGYGAEVLRIDPPGWAEGVAPEITLGKRTATLDLKSEDGKNQFAELLEHADIFVHGYRLDALDGLGLGKEVRRHLNPNLIEVSLNAYGWTGPWRHRRGFDSLIQMSSGIAHFNMVRNEKDTPQPLPLPALDYGAGFLMAAAAIRAIRLRQQSGVIVSARTSLARVAALLISTLSDDLPPALREETLADQSALIEETDWGPARRIKWPALTPAVQPVWGLPARAFHSDPPIWQSAQL